MDASPRTQSNVRTRSFFSRTNGGTSHNEDTPVDGIARLEAIHRHNTDQNKPVEPRVRRKVQKPAPTQDSDATTFRKPMLPASAMRNGTDSKTSPQRNSSVGKDARPLHGPRPLQTSGKRLDTYANIGTSWGTNTDAKRIFSEGTKPDLSSRRTYLPPSSSMPVLDLPFAQRQLESSPSKSSLRPDSLQSSQTFTFLPAVNFDDFQSSIASYESDKGFGAFSSANRVGQTSKRDHGIKATHLPHQPLYMNNHAMRSSPAQPRPPLSETLAARRQMASPSKKSGSSTDLNAARGRRQSALPTTLCATTAAPRASELKSPRKSVGPGLLTNMLREKRSGEDEPPMPTANGRLGSANASPVPGRARARTLTSVQPKATTPIEQSRATAPTQSSKAKAAAQPARTQAQDVATPGSSARRARSSSRPAAGKQHLRATTPASGGNNRQSGRISGLGARTISPTDARRLKRMSLAPPDTPPVMALPAMPILEPMPDFRSTARSPSMIPRKLSLTPNSARDTPDSSAQYFTSTSSLSRSSSFQSLRAGNGTARGARSPSSSRLPTPRARNVYSSADTPDEEIVPPVPAIPKAYESPRDQIDVPFFSTTKIALNDQPSSPVMTNQQPSATAGGQTVSDQQTHLPPSKSLSNLKKPLTGTDYQHFSRPSIGSAGVAGPETRPDAAESAAPKRKTLQPIRLPPLSLQPLSTPTAARIASLPRPSLEVDQRDITPPPKRSAAKTPSTPMTASKATYTHLGRFDDDSRPLYGLRSNTSHYGVRGLDEHYAFENLMGTAPVPIPNASKRQVTPFTSGSLPKTEAQLLQPGMPSPDEYTLGAQASHPQSSKPHGPRPRAFSKPKDIQAAVANGYLDSHETSPIKSGLRRKFSLRRKSSAVKGAERLSNATDSQADTSDASLMLPPILPASAAWLEKLDSPAIRSSIDSPRTSLDTNRRIGSQATISSVQTNDSAAKPEPPLIGARLAYRPLALHSNAVPQSSLTPRSSSWSVSGQPKPAASSVKPLTTIESSARHQNGLGGLNKDDVAADEEMKMLSMKKKDVDVAARLTEALQKQATSKLRMTPAQAIQSSAGLLNIYEKGEIIDYKDGVYFCGSRSAKKHVGDIAAAGTSNFGYDDERGDYNICVGDHLAYRFEVVDVLGKGSFGQVLRCIDHKEGCLVAIKIIRNKKRFHQQALVEVNILNKLKEWDPDGAHASLTVTSSFYFRSHLCIVTPCLSINLYELIKEHSFQGFSLQLIRRFARQILNCLVLLQSKRIIHCDLKPENILLCDRRRADIRVIDFGSSCKSDEKVYTYIQSRFYRSPEVILGSEYGLGIDMWSTGCILAELFTGYPIFPGENEQEQLACIMEIFGPPTKDLVEKCTRRKLFFDSTLKPRVTVSSKGRRRRPSSKTLNMALKCDDDAFLDFLTLCLRWDPEKRLRPDQALNHPFITNEPLRHQPLAPRPRPTLGQARPIPSPTKRTIPGSTVPTTTPARARPLPQTPSAAVRGATTAAVAASIPRPNPDASRASPLKTVAAGTARRQSSLASEGPTTSLPSLVKRPEGGSQLPRMSSGRLPMPSAADLAGAAARESMGLKWR